MHDFPTHHSGSRLRKTSLLLPLFAAFVLLPLAASAEQPPRTETSGVDAPPWVPDECCELAAAETVQHSRPLFETLGEILRSGNSNQYVYPNKDNKRLSATVDPDSPAHPTVALMLVGMGGFIARRRRLR